MYLTIRNLYRKLSHKSSKFKESYFSLLILVKDNLTDHFL